MQDGAPFAFAGLWERWKDRTTGGTLDTYTIITTDPNELMIAVDGWNRATRLALRSICCARTVRMR